MINDDELFEKYKYIGSEIVAIMRRMIKLFFEAHKLTENAKIDDNIESDIDKAVMLLDDARYSFACEILNRFPDLPYDAMSIFYGSYDK